MSHMKKISLTIAATALALGAGAIPANATTGTHSDQNWGADHKTSDALVQGPLIEGNSINADLLGGAGILNGGIGNGEANGNHLLNGNDLVKDSANGNHTANGLVGDVANGIASGNMSESNRWSHSWDKYDVLDLFSGNSNSSR